MKTYIAPDVFIEEDRILTDDGKELTIRHQDDARNFLIATHPLTLCGIEIAIPVQGRICIGGLPDEFQQRDNETPSQCYIRLWALLRKGEVNAIKAMCAWNSALSFSFDVQGFEERDVFAPARYMARCGNRDAGVEQEAYELFRKEMNSMSQMDFLRISMNGGRQPQLKAPAWMILTVLGGDTLVPQDISDSIIVEKGGSDFFFQSNEDRFLIRHQSRDEIECGRVKEKFLHEILLQQDRFHDKDWLHKAYGFSFRANSTLLSNGNCQFSFRKLATNLPDLNPLSLGTR